MEVLQAARKAAFFAAIILVYSLLWIPDYVEASREYKTIYFLTTFSNIFFKPKKKFS